MKRVLSLFAMVALAACGGGAQLSLSSRAGSTAAVAAAPSRTALTLSNGVTVDRVRVAIREVELERADATPDDLKDLQEYEAGPFVLDLSGTALNGSVQTVKVKDVPTGAYREIKFKVHPPSATDSTDPAVLAMASAQQGGASIIIEGQVGGANPGPFTFISALDAEEKYEGTFNFTSGDQNVTLNVDPSSWFGGTGSAFLDPRLGSNKSAIENNIQASMKVFEDDDHNGQDDSTQH